MNPQNLTCAGVIPADTISRPRTGIRIGEMQRLGFEKAVIVTKKPEDYQFFLRDKVEICSSMEEAKEKLAGFSGTVVVAQDRLTKEGIDALPETNGFVSDKANYRFRLGENDTVASIKEMWSSPPQKRMGKVIVGLASYPAREAGMLEVVQRLSPQCDEMHVALNEYEGERLAQVLKKLAKFPNVIPKAYVGEEDLGCQNKFRAVDLCGPDDYFLTVDDDILYPENYVNRLVSGIDRHGGKAICGFHGNIFHSMNGKVVANFKDKDILMYSGETREDREVHLCGMGVSGMMPKRIGVTFSLFMGKKNTGDDEMLTVWAERNGVKRFVLRKPKNWLCGLRHPKGSYKLCTDINSRTKRDMLLNAAEFKDLLLKERLSVTYVSDGSEETESDLLASVNSLATNSNCRVAMNLVCTKVSDSVKNYIGTKVDTLNVIKPPNWMVERCFEANKEAIALGKASATSIALLKFELPYLVDDECTLFLDNDTIVVGDLSQLAGMQSSGSKPVIAAVIDRWRGLNAKSFPVHENIDYFNTGVLVMDLSAMRSSHCHDDLWDAKSQCPEKHLVDQNAFNMVFTGKVMLLPGSYNKSSVSVLSGSERIVHFCGRRQKPRNNPGTRNAELWKKYAVEWRTLA